MEFSNTNNHGSRKPNQWAPIYLKRVTEGAPLRTNLVGDRAPGGSTRSFHFHDRRERLARTSTCVALALFMTLLGVPQVRGQSAPFQLSFTNRSAPVLPGHTVWLDTNASLTAAGVVNWNNGILEVAPLTNFDSSNDKLVVQPAQANLQVQGSDLVFNGAIVGTILQRDGQPRSNLGRLNSDGSVDGAFNPGADYRVQCFAVQSDGRVLVGGNFSKLAGQMGPYLGRLNADGTLDSAFNPQPNDAVYALALQTNGQILVGGGFYEIAGQPRVSIARFNSDGSLDAAFNPGFNGAVICLVVQPDGQILVGGSFSVLAGQPRLSLGRLNSDGSLDLTFNPGADDFVRSLAVQPDGRVLVGGLFSKLAGQMRPYLGRLNADGTLDTAFNPGADNAVDGILAEADGNVLVGGEFLKLAGQPRNFIGLLDSNGSLNSTLNQGPDGAVYSLTAQTNGQVLVGGLFTKFGPQTRAGLARLNSDGSLDPGFNPGADGYVTCLAVQPDGKILVGGSFGRLGVPPLRIEFNTAATTDAINAVLRSLAFTNGLPLTLDALALPEEVRGLRLTLTDGTGNTQIVNQTIEVSYLVRVRFDANVVYVTGNFPGSTVILGALNSAPGNFLEWNGYALNALDLSSPTNCAGIAFDPANQTVYAGKWDVKTPQSCMVELQVGLLSDSLTVFASRDDPCVVDLFYDITQFQGGTGPLFDRERPRSPKQLQPTQLVSAVNFHALESLMNQTAEGRRLANLYWQNTAEIVGIMLSNPPLLQATLQTVQDFQPGIASLLAGSGSEVLITPAMALEVNRLAGQFSILGSPNLRAAIGSEMAAFTNFSVFSNQDFNHWAGMLGIAIPTGAWLQAGRPYMTNGQLIVEANVLPDFNYTLWRAPDLAGSAWTPLTNILQVRNGFTIDLIDTNPPLLGGFYRLSATLSPPTLVNQPFPQAVREGLNATFSVTTSGSQRRYQWQLNGDNIPVATNDTLTLTDVSLCQAGLYTVTVSNGGGAVTSAPAILWVTPRTFHILTNDLLAHLTFDSDYSDASGHGFNGTPIGAPALGPGEVGSGALRFTTLQDGSSFNYVTLGTNLVKQIATNDFSLAFWINLTNAAGDVPLAANTDWRGGTNVGFALVERQVGGLIFSAVDRAGSSAFTHGGLIADGTWHHVALTCQRRGFATVYQDGVATGTAYLVPLSGSLDSGLPLNLGQDGRGNFFISGKSGVTNGFMDDLGIWQRVLGPDEVAGLYQQGRESLTFDRVPERPVILSQPCSQTVTEGLNATFNVISLGESPAYQWRFNGNRVADVTSPALLLTNVQLAQAGDYTVVLSNAFGAITSNPAILTVNPRPFFVLTNSLLAHLPFDGSYEDVSGHGNPGTPVGAPSLASGKVGSGALGFTTLRDGSSFNYVTLGTNIVKQIASNDFSVAFWINISNLIGNPVLLANEDSANPTSAGFELFCGTGGTLAENVAIGLGVPLATNASVIADGTWHHVALTYLRGNVAVLYQDGAPGALTALYLSGNLDGGLPLNIGQDGQGNYFGSGTTGVTNALLDDLGVWQRALGRREVEFIFLQGRDGVTFDRP